MESQKQLVFGNIDNSLQKEELIYLAAFFDGEGNVSILYTKTTIAHPYEQYSLMVSVTQKDKGILESYKPFGGSIYYNKRGKGFYQWHIHGVKAVKFLKAILPYLRLKTKQAQKGIEFQDLIRHQRGKGMPPISPSLLAKQAEAYKEFKQLN